MSWTCRGSVYTLQVRVPLWLPAALWCGVIFAGSSVHGSPNSDPTWLDWSLRKSAHLGEYAVLFMLARRALAGGDVPPIFPGVWAFLFCVAYAASDEYHQTFVLYRQGQTSDVLIDALGALLASRVGRKT